VLEALDFLLRLAFFAIAPRLLVFAAALWPVTGAIAQIALALSVFLVGEAARGLASRSKLAARILGGHLQFDAYYRENPPKPFLYYLFYPLLFPYWLTNPAARREFLLYKGYTLASIALMFVSLGVQFVRFYPPELTLHDFVPIAIKTFLAETLVVLVFCMPIVTSVVHFHLRHERWRLATILVAGIVSSGLAVARIEKERDPIVSLATRERVRLRTMVAKARAYEALAIALGQAWKELPRDKDDVDADGKVEGAPLEKARLALERFYRTDETFAFDMWRSKKGKKETLVIYFEARGDKPPVWLAMEAPGSTFSVAKRLPLGALAAMKSAADGIGESR
jgi:hypothetical protein